MSRTQINTLFTVLALVFVVFAIVGAVGVLPQLPGQSLATPTGNATPPPFAADVETRVRNASPDAGSTLFAQYGCMRCHGTASSPGPYFVGIGQRAATRRPGYSAAAYIYESITSPNAYVVPGYPAGLMPQNLKEQIPENQIYTLIAWLLTQ